MSDRDDVPGTPEALAGRLRELRSENARLRAEVSRLSGQRLSRLPRSEIAPFVDPELLQAGDVTRFIGSLRPTPVKVKMGAEALKALFLAASVRHASGGSVPLSGIDVVLDIGARPRSMRVVYSDGHEEEIGEATPRETEGEGR